MESIAQKRILLVGNDVSFAANLEHELCNKSAEVERVHAVVAADYSTVQVDDYDLIIITQLYDPGTHDAFLNLVNNRQLAHFLPVLVNVDLERNDMERVLLKGAADFFSEADSLTDLVDKITAAITQNDSCQAKSAIDISSSHHSPPTSTEVRVFVVEDDPLLRNLLKEKFIKSNITAEFSPDGKAILPSVASFKPTVLILDLMLPGKNGLDVLKELKADNLTSHIPVIIFSNRDSASDRQRATELGASAFYIKAMTDLSELTTILTDYSK